MRLLKIGLYYPAYLAHFYARRPELSRATYATQHAALLSDGFGSADFWTQALAPLGYAGAEIIANADVLQQRWATEKGVRFTSQNWFWEILRAQVLGFRPDVLLVADYSTLTAAFLHELRAACPSLRLIIVWCAAPYRDGSIFHAADLVLSGVPEMVAQFRADGHRSEHLYPAFAPQLLDRIDLDAPQKTAFAFLGSVVTAAEFHNTRAQLLVELQRSTPLEIWTETATAPQGWRQKVKSEVSSWLRPTPVLSESAQLKALINSRAHPPLFGLAMYQQLHNSKIALNTHIDISPRNASNMRLFEATGSGTCLLTDWRENLPTLFTPDAEIVTYRTAAECRAKVLHLLEHEAERRAIAAAGQRRTLQAHTFAQRARELDAVIRQALGAA